MAGSRHSVSVAAAIVREDGRVLLTQRHDNGHWEAPGGVLELNETIEDGVAREVAEETGLSVDIETLTGVYKNMPRGIVALVFRCRLRAGQPTTNAEVDAFRWATRDDLDALMDPAYAVRVRDAIDYAGTPTIRAHDGVSVLVTSMPR